jgi:hypothetical protein
MKRKEKRKEEDREKNMHVKCGSLSQGVPASKDVPLILSHIKC